MTKDLINIDLVNKFSEIYKQSEKLPTKDISEKYGRVTELKIIGWSLGCMYASIMHKKGYTFEKIQQLILNNTQSPFYVCIPTLCREAWIWENILSKAGYLLKDSHLTKSWYKRMSQYKKYIPNPIKELKHIATRKQEESIKHKRYSVRNWEDEKGFVTLQKEYICDVCNRKVDKFKKVCKKCMEGINEN